MELTINGERMQSASATVAELVAELALNPTQVAVELQGAIVPKSAYAATKLHEGDRVEIVRFIGGG